MKTPELALSLYENIGTVPVFSNDAGRKSHKESPASGTPYDKSSNANFGLWNLCHSCGYSIYVV